MRGSARDTRVEVYLLDASNAHNTITVHYISVHFPTSFRLNSIHVQLPAAAQCNLPSKLLYCLQDTESCRQIPKPTAPIRHLNVPTQLPETCNIITSFNDSIKPAARTHLHLPYMECKRHQEHQFRPEQSCCRNRRLSGLSGPLSNSIRLICRP